MRDFAGRYAAAFRDTAREAWCILCWLGWKRCVLAVVLVMTIEETIVLIGRYA